MNVVLLRCLLCIGVGLLCACSKLCWLRVVMCCGVVCWCVVFVVCCVVV